MYTETFWYTKKAMKVRWMAIGMCFAFAMSGCNSTTKPMTNEAAPITRQVDLKKLQDGPQFAVKEQPLVYEREPIKTQEDLQKVKTEFFGLDIRATDVSAVSLKDEKAAEISFDSKTIWPKEVPNDFDYEKILELGKNPGLGIRKLHEQGITGKGVHVAIIDLNVLPDHEEYKGKIQLYEKLHSDGNQAEMHGMAVTSILAGKDIGVAPDVHIYYISCDFVDDAGTAKEKVNLSYMAQAIHRIIEINQALPEDEKIKVLTIQRAFTMEEDSEVFDAIEDANAQGIFVITPSLEENYGVYLYGLERSLMQDGDTLSSYHGEAVEGREVLYVPMAHRSIAGPFSTTDYEHISKGGISWTCPWLAGLYALCVQVNPELDGAAFLRLALETGDKVEADKTGGKGRTVIVNPQRLIEKVKER